MLPCQQIEVGASTVLGAIHKEANTGRRGPVYVSSRTQETVCTGNACFAATVHSRANSCAAVDPAANSGHVPSPPLAPPPGWAANCMCKQLMSACGRVGSRSTSMPASYHSQLILPCVVAYSVLLRNRCSDCTLKITPTRLFIAQNAFPLHLTSKCTGLLLAPRGGLLQCGKLRCVQRARGVGPGLRCAV
jgi:hypothetical protein